MEQSDSFGYWLRRRRKALDLTQSSLADQAGCSTATIKRIEADERRPSRVLAARLAAVLGVPADEQATFLAAARGRGRVGLLGVGAAPISAPRGLPAPPNQLIGREREADELGALLRSPDTRMVTLTGPGGIGKSRLALHVASRLGSPHGGCPCFRDGVRAVDLAPLGDPAQVLPAIARALGLHGHGHADPAEQLAWFVRDQELLLVLDNFEHVLAAAPDLAALLEAAPGLRLLVTSRSALRLRAEHEYPVPPLALPPAPTAPGWDVAESPGPAAAESDPARYAAVALFIDRARAARPGLIISGPSAWAAAEICRRLDGLPLAIELAAARARVFTPEALLAHLESPLALLVGGPHDLPPRQQTLRAAIDWSFELLGEAEQILFARLAVFRGGWSLAAAEGVAADGQRIRAGLVLDLLTTLADQSLVWAVVDAGQPRFDMLATLREYALERLNASGEADALHRRHALFYLDLAEPASVELRRGGQLDWLALLHVEQNNLQAALAWGLRHEPDLALRLAVAAWWYWGLRGHLREGITWMDRVLAANSAPSGPRARALLGAAVLNERLGRPGRCAGLAQESLTLAREQGDQECAALALVLLAATERRNWGAAERLAGEAEGLARRWGEDWALAQALIERGEALTALHSLGEARACFAEALGLCRRSGDRWAIASALFRSTVCEPAHAARLATLEEAERLACEVGDHYSQGIIINALAGCARELGDDAQAARWYERSLGLVRLVGNHLVEGLTLANKARLALQQRDLRGAARDLRRSMTIYRKDRPPPLAGALLLSASLLAQARHDSVTAARLLGWADLALEDAILALRPYDEGAAGDVRRAARVALGQAEFRAAYAAGQARSQDEALREAEAVAEALDLA